MREPILPKDQAKAVYRLARRHGAALQKEMEDKFKSCSSDMCFVYVAYFLLDILTSMPSKDIEVAKDFLESLRTTVLNNLTEVENFSWPRH